MTKVALVYDFDKTLCTRNMQEYSFIPSLNMPTKEFWDKTRELSEKEGMDPILAYMYCMVKFGDVRRSDLVSQGANVELFPGVTEWFDLVNGAGKELGLEIEHYVISSGLREIIEGTSIFKHFAEVFSCEFLYDDDKAIWVKNVINYTTKTQSLFRISKGCMDISDDRTVNNRSYGNYRIPFTNMIYIADGITDIPCMKLVRTYGGFAIAVHNGNKDIANELIKDGRADFVCRSDYSESSEIYSTMIDILKKIAIDSKLRGRHNECLCSVEGEISVDGFTEKQELDL